MGCSRRDYMQTTLTTHKRVCGGRPRRMMLNVVMRRGRRLVLAAAAASVAVSVTVAAETRQIDTAQSKVTVFVYKSGLFSGFADDHIIDAPIAGGTVSETSPLSVAIE